MSLITTLKTLIFGDPNKKILQYYQPRVDAINALHDEISALSDDELKAKTDAFKERLKKNETVDDLLIEAFAVVREASSRVLHMRHFDVQLIGGMVLHEGLIAEMRTGEGKTLVATLAAYLNALEAKGVYVVTVNDYLAKRDSEWMGQVYTFLGLTVGVIQSGISQENRIKAYGADITYGTNNEFGFDYLRDNLAHSKEDCCQLRRHYAIIDEVDSILIDEARTPLIISGPIQESPDKFKKAAKIVRVLEIEKDFTVDEKHKNIVLTDDGIVKLEKSLGLDNIYSVEHMDAAHMVVQCLKALHIFKRDVDYVLKDGEIVIVDEFTGRLMDGRRYSDGLHQAIEAIENVKIREESQTLASVTFQNYFRMFPKLSGMTGTAVTEASEFESIYSLSVVPIPTNMPVTRKDVSDVVYNTKNEKYNAIVAHIAELHEVGQPVLVGTISIETSELISKFLKIKKIKHTVLNAKQHEKEADIISNAGKKGAVTIATNMAGRGTDIVLGEGVKELGGLCVIGTGRHESRRIDNQLRGRSGRQGDPGITRFYVALEDDLMRMFGSDRISKIMAALKMPEDTPIESPLISKSIEKAQSKVEKYHFSIRKQILEYDDVMSQQRDTIYGIRRKILERVEIGALVKEGISDLVTGLFIEHAGQEPLKDAEAIESLAQSLKAVYPSEGIAKILNSNTKNDEKIKALKSRFMSGYENKKAAYPPGFFDTVVSAQVLLVNLDRKWMDHLNNMDILREGIGLRAWGQRHPLIEYKREAYDMFTELRLNIYEESLSMIFRAELVEKPTKVLAS
jgi:preprotein translocase subunit SecA